MDVNIYSKVCLSCVMGEEWVNIQTTLIKNGYNLKVRRTTYDRSLHELATKLWGSDNYIAFAEFPDGKVMGLGEIKGMFEDIKDKLVKEGKSKPIRKKRSRKSDLRGLSKTKRPSRKNHVEGSPNASEMEDKA